MPHIVDSQVLEIVSAPGTAAFSLGGAVTGFKRFNAARNHITDTLIAVADTTEYRAVAVDANGVPTGLWEEGLGTYSALNTLTRTTVLRNSAGDTSAINFASGSVYVGLVNGSRRGVFLDNERALPLPVLTAQPTSLASTMKLYAISRANHALPAFIGPSGIDTTIQPAIFSNRVGLITPARTTSINIFGCGVQTSATLSHPTPSTNSMAESLYRTRFQTSTTAGNASGVRSDVWAVRGNGGTGRGGFWFVGRMCTGSIALSGGQMVFGLQGGNAALGGEPSALTNLLAIGKDIADTNLQFMRNDGSGTAVKTDLGIAYAANVALQIRLWCPPSSSEIWVLVERINNDGTLTSLLDTSYTTDIPATTTFLAMHCQVRNGATAAAANVEMVQMYCESDF